MGRPRGMRMLQQMRSIQLYQNQLFNGFICRTLYYNAIRRGNYAYADKTHWLPIFENLYSSYPFIIRPRRFGKSVFMSMIASEKAIAEKLAEAQRHLGDYGQAAPFKEAEGLVKAVVLFVGTELQIIRYV